MQEITDVPEGMYFFVGMKFVKATKEVTPIDGDVTWSESALTDFCGGKTNFYPGNGFKNLGIRSNSYCIGNLLDNAKPFICQHSE